MTDYLAGWLLLRVFLVWKTEYTHLEPSRFLLSPVPVILNVLAFVSLFCAAMYPGASPVSKYFLVAAE